MNCGLDFPKDEPRVGRPVWVVLVFVREFLCGVFVVFVFFLGGGGCWLVVSFTGEPMGQLSFWAVSFFFRQPHFG